MGQGHPSNSEAGFEFSGGCGSTSGLQSALTNSGLSVPTSAEFSFLPEDAGPCLMAVDQPGLEGFANLSGPVSSDPVSAFAPPGVALLVISSPCSAFSGCTANASSSKEQLLGQSRRTQGYNK
jgi:hypothetical protein